MLVEITIEDGVTGWGEDFGPARLTAPVVEFYAPLLVLLCHMILTRGRCFWRQQGQRGRTWTRPTVRQRRMVAMEFGTCRSGRTGTARLETAG